MDFSWTREQEQLCERMRALGATAQAAPPEERLGLLAAGGVLGLGIAREHGGGGHGALDMACAFEGLGRTLDDAGVLLAAGAHLFGVACPIQQVGSEAQRRRWLGPMARGATIGTVAATEAEAGSNVMAVRAVVEPRAGGWSARGQKRYVTNADRASLLLFLGANAGGRGLTVALVPATDAVVVGPPYDTLGLSGARLAPVEFRDCPIEQDALLGKPGAGMAVFQLAMTYERALVLAFRLGAMARALDDAVGFVRTRKLGDRRIAEHQAVSHRLARMKRRLESARLLVYRAAWEIDRGGKAHAEAALAKWLVADAALESALDAVQLRGGEGFLSEAGLGGTVHDTLGGTIHSGTQDVCASIVSRWLGL